MMMLITFLWKYTEFKYWINTLWLQHHYYHSVVFCKVWLICMLYLLTNCHWHSFLTKGFQVVEGLRAESRQGCHFSFVTRFQPQHPSWVAPHEFIYCNCFYWSFFSKDAMHVLWVYLFFACCVFYLLFGFIFLYVQSCIVSMIVLLRPTIGINTCFFSAYKLCSYNKQYEKMWHLFQKVLYGYFFVSGKLWAKKSSNATIKGYFSWCPKERQKQAELVGLKWRLFRAEWWAWKGWCPVCGPCTLSSPCINGASGPLPTSKAPVCPVLGLLHLLLSQLRIFLSLHTDQ